MARCAKALRPCACKNRCVAAFETSLGDADVLVCLVTMGSAYRHIEPRRFIRDIGIYTDPVRIDGSDVPYLRAFAGYTIPFNATGSPVAVIPIGLDEDGMPVGAQIVGRKWSDRRVLDVAQMIFDRAGSFRLPGPSTSSE